MPLKNLNASCPSGWYLSTDTDGTKFVGFWDGRNYGRWLGVDGKAALVNCRHDSLTDFVRLVPADLSLAAEPEIRSGPCELSGDPWWIESDGWVRLVYVTPTSTIPAGWRAIKVVRPTFPPCSPVMLTGPKPEVCAWRFIKTHQVGKVFLGLESLDRIMCLPELWSTPRENCERVPEVGT